MTVPDTESEISIQAEPHATELRLALVCFGGVSLAIYMHGVTKELHYLVSASRAFERAGADGQNPFDKATESRWAYFEALRDLAHSGRPTTVTIDVISGTSAGGINGVCLAKVLARDGSQDALKQLWITEGDLKKLLNYARIGGWRFRAAVAGVWTALGGGKPRSPLRGDRMSRLLYDAISQMEPAGPPSTLIPTDGSLDLFVTTTDLNGFPVLVGTGWGGVSQRENDNAQVLEFHPDAPDAFGPDSVGALAFSARATSSFPGAFPPVSLQSFTKELQGRKFLPSQVAAHFRNRYQTKQGSSDESWFVDGGVLDNAPFDLVVEAVAQKQAASEVVRELVYIEPDPGGSLAVANTPQPTADSSEPGYFAALMRGVFSVKGSHSVLGELERLRDLNIRIAEIGDITALQMSQVTAEVDSAWHDLTTQEDSRPRRTLDIDDRADVTALGDAMHQRVPNFVNAGYATYCRLKVDEVGRRLADEVAEHYAYPADSSRSSFVRAAITAWAHDQPQWRDADPGSLLSLLGPVDIPYRERRLLFVLAGINDLYTSVGTPGGPDRATLDFYKQTAWTLLTTLRALPEKAVTELAGQGFLAFLGDGLTEDDVYANPAAYADSHRAGFTRAFGQYRDLLEEALEGTTTLDLWEAFSKSARTRPADWQVGLLTRYLGFPLWDALIFPTVSLGKLPQFTPIGVRQYSPLEAKALGTPETGKLKGVSLHHFGGFTKTSFRQNDYLWGRLDAAELVLRTLRGTGRPGPETGVVSPADAVLQAGQQLRPAVTAIVASETDLTEIDDDTRRFIASAIAGLP